MKAASSARAEGSGRPVWRLLSRLLPIVVAVAFVALLANALRTIDWQDIEAALASYRWLTLALALGFAVLVHGIASSYDLLARRFETHAVPARRCIGIAHVAYAVSISLSAILGSWALRYRLYGRSGLPYAQITRLTLFAIVTNWSGFLLLAGIVFALAPPPLPSGWPLSSAALRLVGVGFLLLALAYPIGCALARGRTWQWRETTVHWPSVSLAFTQLLLSAALWASLAALVHTLLPKGATYLEVLAAVLITATAGLVVRVPAGVGVAELVFMTLLGPELGKAKIIAALLLYRCFYQLLPLASASIAYAVMELGSRREAAAAKP